jgi:hypothetical protein
MLSPRKIANPDFVRNSTLKKARFLLFPIFISTELLREGNLSFEKKTSLK